MRPTTTELLEQLDHVLETQIMPRLPDEHTKARMSVASQIVRAVHNRVRLEGRLLATDNADVAALLVQLGESEDPGPEVEYVEVETLAARNNELKARLVDAIHRLDSMPPEERQAADASVNQYLRRELDRELELTALPVFGETTADLPLV